MKKHYHYVKTHLNTVIKKIGFGNVCEKKINIKECCDSFTLNNNFVNKNHSIFQIKNRINKNFIYEKNLNDDSDYFIDNVSTFDNDDFGKIKNHKNKDREKFINSLKKKY